MTDRLHLKPRHRAMLERLFAEHLPGIEVWAYGSRINGRSHDGSDLDLVLRGPGLKEIPEDHLLGFRDAVRESNIPFLVEAWDWARFPELIHRQIERDYVEFVSQPVNSSSLIGSNWPELPFSEAVSINPPVSLQRDRSYPHVDMAMLTPGLRSVKSDVQREFRGGGSRFEPGDTLMARITPCLENGKISRFNPSEPTDSGPAHGSTEFIVLRGKQNVSDSAYVHYLAKSPEMRKFAISQMSGTSGRQRVPTDCFDHLLVSIPPLSEQREIARILGALDDRIELNRRMNETLEMVARATFRDWFVDFGPTRAKMEGRIPYLASGFWELFPSSLDCENKPVGWKQGILSDVVKPSRRGVSPADVSDSTPYIGLEHMPRRSIALSEWGKAEKVKSNKTRFNKGDILFGKLRPYFHKVGIAPIDGICSTDIVVVVPRAKEWEAFALACMSSDEFVDYTNRTSTGTKMPRTNWKTMARYQMCLPPENVVRAFHGVVGPFLDRLCANINETFTLIRIRDLLLPKLIAGKIRIPEAERMVESVV